MVRIMVGGSTEKCLMWTLYAPPSVKIQAICGHAAPPTLIM